MMEYRDEITANQNNAKGLEELYRLSQREHQAAEFAAAMLACHEAAPDNLLYAAWYYRLLPAAPTEAPAGAVVSWRPALVLSVVAGIVFAVLATHWFNLGSGVPFPFLFWAPLGAGFVMVFLAVTNRDLRARLLPCIAGLAITCAYVLGYFLFVWRFGSTYQVLTMVHLPIAAVSALGLLVVGWRSGVDERFAFLAKCVEVLITGGLFVMAGGVLAIITFAMFAALGIKLPMEIQNLLIAGGGGLIVVWAVAVAYDPNRSPVAQDFDRGLARLIGTMMRLLLPLSLVVLVAYLLVIPFSFMEPFRSREVLIVYNAMLFAVMALLLGATPVRPEDLPQRYHTWLRAGIVAVAALTLIISLYALSATVYRTALGGLTPNRLTVIGWNMINIGLLALLLVRQRAAGAAGWVRAVQSVFHTGSYAYVAWTLVLIAVVPWMGSPG